MGGFELGYPPLCVVTALKGCWPNLWLDQPKPQKWQPHPKRRVEWKENKAILNHLKLHLGATVSEIWRIRRFYTNDAEKDTIIDDDEKFQLI